MKKIIIFIMMCVLLMIPKNTVNAAEDNTVPIIVSDTDVSLQQGSFIAINVSAIDEIEAIIADEGIATITVDENSIIIVGNNIGSTYAVVYLKSDPNIAVSITITVTENNQKYEYMAAEGYRYLVERDASSLNPGTLSIIRAGKVDINDKNFIILSKMASTCVVIEYSKINDYGFSESKSIILLKSTTRTSAWNQIISNDGTYTTVMGMKGLQLDEKEHEELDLTNVLNYASEIKDIEWFVGTNNHKM